MKAYLISLAVGLLVGVIYSLLDVRSPAPPVIAILGLLGMLAGEQIIPGWQAIAPWHLVCYRLRQDTCHGPCLRPIARTAS